MLSYILTAGTLIAQTAAGFSETSVHVYKTTPCLLTLQKLQRMLWREGN